MGKVTAGITISVDGYVAAPDDGPGKGLGEGGERLHYWVFGGPWRYEDEGRGGGAVGEDAAFLEEATANQGAVICGRNMYEAARHWGDKNPFGVPIFVLTHTPDDEHEAGEFTFVDGFDSALERAREAAGEKDVGLAGGADVIRQGLAAGVVDELTIIVSPVVLGGGKRLFEGFEQSLDLEQTGIRQSNFATFISYRVV